jgi:hypothetical protein
MRHNGSNFTHGDTRHIDSNFSYGDMSCSDNDGGFSIESKNIKERGNHVADDGGGRFISTQAQNKPVRLRPVLFL